MSEIARHLFSTAMSEKLRLLALALEKKKKNSFPKFKFLDKDNFSNYSIVVDGNSTENLQQFISK